MVFAEAALAVALQRPNTDLNEVNLDPAPKTEQVELQPVVERLRGDWDFIAEFLDNPDAALSGFELSTEAYRALATRDAAGLMELGLGQEEALEALSGAHSQTCGGRGAGNG